MRVVKYLCDKCGRETEEIYQVELVKLDTENGDYILDLPQEVEDEVSALIEDKQLCRECGLKAVRRAYSKPATINEDFDKAIDEMIIQARKPRAKELVEVEPEIQVDTVSQQKVESAAVSQQPNPSVCKITKEELEPMCNAGMTVQAIADKTGFNYGQIYRKIKSYDLKLNTVEESKQLEESPRPESEAVHQEPISTDNGPEDVQPENELQETLSAVDVVRMLYVNAGKNIEQTAKEMGLTIDEVRRIILQNKIFKSNKLREQYDKTVVPQSII